MKRAVTWSASMVATGMLFLSTPSTWAQPPVSAASPAGWERIDVFRVLLQLEGVRFVSGFADLQDDPEQSMLVVLGGDLSELGIDAGALDRFLGEGGVALIATDQRSGALFQQTFHIGVTGEHLQTPRKADGYRGNSKCPFVRRTDRWLFRGLSRIATNVPSRFSEIETEQAASDRSRVVAEIGPVRDEAGQQFGTAPFAVRVPYYDRDGNERGGEALLLADHSLFINEMLLQTDNDNLEFALRCVRWLGHSPVERTKVLFVAPGQPLPIPPVGIPPVGVLNGLLRGMEREDLFNRMLLSQMDHDRLLGGVALALAAIALLFGAFRALQSRFRIDGGSPLFAKSLADMSPAATLVEQRHRSMVESGGLWELARDRAVQLIGDIGCPPPAARDSGDAPEPVLWVSGGWWQRQILRRKALRLWHLACSDTPEPFTPRAYTRILEDAAAVEAAVADGLVRFGPTGGSLA